MRYPKEITWIEYVYEEQEKQADCVDFCNSPLFGVVVGGGSWLTPFVSF